MKDTFVERMVSTLNNTNNFLNNKEEGALFALSRLIRKGNLSRLTTTIRQEKFEGCSVDIATIVSSDGTVMPTCYVVWPTT